MSLEMRLSHVDADEKTKPISVWMDLKQLHINTSLAFPEMGLLQVGNCESYYFGEISGKIIIEYRKKAE